MRELNKKDKKLLDQLIEEMRYPTLEILLDYYKDRQSAYEELDHYPGNNRKWAPLCEAGAGVLPLLDNRAIDAILDFGIVEAYHSGNMQVLHDALYTYTRLHFPRDRYLAKKSDGSIDVMNEYVLCREIIEAFAACDTAIVKKYCPENSPVLTKGYKMWVVGYNLILGFLYHDEKRVETGVRQAEKALTTKIPQFDAAVISYLLALAKHDVAEANRQFAMMLSVYRKSGLFNFHDDFLKVFAMIPHGLYNIANLYLTKEDFLAISPPEDTAFWNGLAEYQKQAGFSCGEPYIVFTDELQSLNVLYDSL